MKNLNDDSVGNRITQDTAKSTSQRTETISSYIKHFVYSLGSDAYV